MAVANLTQSTINQGAIQAVVAISLMQETARACSDKLVGSPLSPEDQVAIESEDIRVSIDSAMAMLGDLPAYQAGFVRALLEIIDFQMRYGGDPDLNVWKPDAALSDKEVASKRMALISAIQVGREPIHAEPDTASV